jgi:hypothetical protein
MQASGEGLQAAAVGTLETGRENQAELIFLSAIHSCDN